MVAVGTFLAANVVAEMRQTPINRERWYKRTCECATFPSLEVRIPPLVTMGPFKPNPRCFWFPTLGARWLGPWTRMWVRGVQLCCVTQRMSAEPKLSTPAGLGRQISVAFSTTHIIGSHNPDSGSRTAKVHPSSAAPTTLNINFRPSFPPIAGEGRRD